MSVIILLLAASLSVALIFLGAFLWSVKNKQFDDDYSPPQRILFDDAPLATHLGPGIGSGNTEIPEILK
jgi:cbb3-type cytochrome oxidase maturation protein